MERSLALRTGNKAAAQVFASLLALLLSMLLAHRATAQQIMVTVSSGTAGDPFNRPEYVVLDSGGNIFVSDAGNHRVRRIDRVSGAVTTVAGTGIAGSTGDGGPALSAQLNCPSGMAFGKNGSLLIADPCANIVRIVSPSATDGLIEGRSDESIALFAGGGTSTSPGPGIPAIDLMLDLPTHVAVDAADSVYIGDETNTEMTIVGVDASGNTFPVAEVSWILPLSLAVNSSGQLLTGGDGDDYPLLSCIDASTPPPSNQYTIVGNPFQGIRYADRVGIATDASGNVYTNLFSRHSIVKLSAPAGLCGYDPNSAAPFAGTGTQDFTGDGGPPVDATLNSPTGIAFNKAGNLFIADTGNNVIRGVVNGAATDGTQTVNPPTQNGDASPVTVIFNGGVTQPGSTVVVVSQTAPALPAGFQLAGTPAAFFDVITSATFTAPLTVCINMNPVPPGATLQHFNSATQMWEDKTVQPVPANGPICAQVNSLSPFAILTPIKQNQAPAFTSPAAATFQTGVAGAFTVTATGYPTPALSESGALPGGVTFNSSTGVLSGTPSAGAGGVYPVSFAASNGVSPNAQQSFILTVDQAAAIASARSAAFTLGAPGSFTVTSTGFPTAVLSESGVLPTGVGFVDNGKGTGTLSGAPTASGVFNISFTAANRVGASATQSFTLTVSGGGPIVTVSPGSINFGHIDLFHFAAGRVTLTNSGSSNLKIGRIWLTRGSGADWDDFLLLDACRPELAPGKSCVIHIYFFADELGTHTATLNIADDAPGSPQQVSLTGTAIRRWLH